MTAKQDTTLKLEDVPLKRDFRLSRESLPENIEKTFTQMDVGQSFFLVTLTMIIAIERFQRYGLGH